MGNHDVGRVFALAFEIIEDQLDSMSKEQVLEAFDKVGNYYRGADAEFDDHTDPSQPLGRALIKAFAPEGFPLSVTGYSGQEEFDEWYKLWYDQVYTPFKNRYQFY